MPHWIVTILVHERVQAFEIITINFFAALHPPIQLIRIGASSKEGIPWFEGSDGSLRRFGWRVQSVFFCSTHIPRLNGPGSHVYGADRVFLDEVGRRRPWSAQGVWDAVHAVVESRSGNHARNNRQIRTRYGHQHHNHQRCRNGRVADGVHPHYEHAECVTVRSASQANHSKATADWFMRRPPQASNGSQAMVLASKQ